MPTVLITGGHEGIGLAAAKQLASGQHLNLLLAGRNLARVETAAQQIRQQYGVIVSAVQLDLSSLVSVHEALTSRPTAQKDIAYSADFVSPEFTNKPYAADAEKTGTLE